MPDIPPPQAKPRELLNVVSRVKKAVPDNPPPRVNAPELDNGALPANEIVPYNPQKSPAKSSGDNPVACQGLLVGDGGGVEFGRE